MLLVLDLNGTPLVKLDHFTSGFCWCTPISDCIKRLVPHLISKQIERLRLRLSSHLMYEITPIILLLLWLHQKRHSFRRQVKLRELFTLGVFLKLNFAPSCSFNILNVAVHKRIRQHCLVVVLIVEVGVGVERTRFRLLFLRHREHGSRYGL